MKRHGQPSSLYHLKQGKGIPNVKPAYTDAKKITVISAGAVNQVATWEED